MITLTTHHKSPFPETRMRRGAVQTGVTILSFPHTFISWYNETHFKLAIAKHKRAKKRN